MSLKILSFYCKCYFIFQIMHLEYSFLSLYSSSSPTSQHLLDEAYLIMMDDIFYVFLDSFCVLLKSFASKFTRVIGCSVLLSLFFFGSSCSLGNKVTVTLQNKLGNVHFVSISWDNLNIIGVNASLKSGGTICPWAFLLRRENI